MVWAELSDTVVTAGSNEWNPFSRGGGGAGAARPAAAPARASLESCTGADGRQVPCANCNKVQCASCYNASGKRYNCPAAAAPAAPGRAAAAPGGGRARAPPGAQARCTGADGKPVPCMACRHQQCTKCVTANGREQPCPTGPAAGKTSGCSNARGADAVPAEMTDAELRGSIGASTMTDAVKAIFSRAKAMSRRVRRCERPTFLAGIKAEVARAVGGAAGVLSAVGESTIGAYESFRKAHGITVAAKAAGCDLSSEVAAVRGGPDCWMHFHERRNERFHGAGEAAEALTGALGAPGMLVTQFGNALAAPATTTVAVLGGNRDAQGLTRAAVGAAATSFIPRNPVMETMERGAAAGEMTKQIGRGQYANAALSAFTIAGAAKPEEAEAVHLSAGRTALDGVVGAAQGAAIGAAASAIDPHAAPHGKH